jgi:hypothetical protein
MRIRPEPSERAPGGAHPRSSYRALADRDPKKKKTSDWADLLALKIMADAHRYPFDEAASLIADRLRRVRQEGELAGMRNVLDQLRTDERKQHKP